MNLSKSKSISRYRITPITFECGKKSTFTVEALGKGVRHDPIFSKMVGKNVGFLDELSYQVKIIPMEAYEGTYVEDNVEVFTETVHPCGGVITVSYTFPDEQEWVVSVKPLDESEKMRKPIEFRVYSLSSDLYVRNPYRGDLHVHSIGSDGGEEPAVVAANYRKWGYDFMALTDHRTYTPSEEMVEAYRDVPLDIALYKGEEVHPRGNIHVVHFGGKYSINELYRSNAEGYHKALVREAENISVPNGVDVLEYCYRKWIYEEIKKACGMCVAVHPFWVHSPGIYNMNTKMLEYVFRTGIFDLFELTGGQSVHENNVQTAFWQEMRAQGVKIPIVGSSDSHGTDPASYFGISKTVLFATDTDFDSVCSAIKDGYSVAVEEPYGEEARVYGPYRLVKYVRFLLDRYFPAHDELCVEEGRLMREYALGDSEAGVALSALHGRVARYTERVLRGKK